MILQVPNPGDVPIPSIPNHLYPEKTMLNPAGGRCHKEDAFGMGVGEKACLASDPSAAGGKGYTVACMFRHESWGTSPPTVVSCTLQSSAPRILSHPCCSVAFVVSGL